MYDPNSSTRLKNIKRHETELKWIKFLQSPFPLGFNDNIYHEGNISKMPDFDVFSVLECKKRKSRSHGKRKNGNIKRKICTEKRLNTSLKDLSLALTTVKSRLSERRLSETTRLFEDDGQSRLFSLLSIAIKLPIIRISIIQKNQFSEVIRRSRLKKLLSNYHSRFEVHMSRMVIMIFLFGRVRLTHLSDLANKVETGN